MKISILKTFVTVVEEKSLSRAAEVLYLTQPAVSKHIKALERYFNASFFHRQGQRVSLTEEGELFYTRAKGIIKKWEEALQAMEELRGKVGGLLKLGASTIPGEYILPYLLGSYKEKYPEVDIKLEIGDTGKIVRMLLNEEIHVGVVGAQVERKRLKAKKFFEDEIVLIMPPHHPFAQKEKIFIPDLLQDKLIWRERGSGTRKVVEEKLIKEGYSLEKFQPVLELGSTQSIITAVEAGLGISLVSLWAVKKEQALNKLVTKSIEGLSLKRDLFLLYPREQYLPRSAVVFLKFMEEFKGEILGEG